MLKTKLLASILLASAVLFAQAGLAAAAPTAQDTTLITGTIQSIAAETDSNGVATVLVTVLDNLGATQTVRLSVDTAISLGLVTLDPVTSEPVVNETQIGQPIQIDPVTVIPDEMSEEPAHPIAVLLAAFFGEDASVVNDYHQDGFGFGVIAQAMWMSKNLNEDATLAGLILDAKKSGDYSEFILPDGSTPTNWGQFKKAVSEKKNNLGIVVSENAELDDSVNPSAQQEHQNGKDKDKNNGKGKDKNKNKP